MNRCQQVTLLVTGAVILPALASATALDKPLLASEVQGHAKIVVIVQAGESGAPAGFTVQWLPFSDFLANGGQFYAESGGVQSEAHFTGTPTLNTWDGMLTTFLLGSNALAAVEIGDMRDETGVQRNAPADLELEKETAYIFRARAIGDGVFEDSEWSNVFIVSSETNANCTYTQGFWKNHPEAWPVGSLTLGTASYTQAQLLAILDEPAHGNGLVILAHQLIATLLNLEQGADDTDIASQVASAQSVIGGLVVPPIGSGYLSPGSVNSLSQDLDDYNNGITGPGHCGPTAVAPSSWSNVKSAYR